MSGGDGNIWDQFARQDPYWAVLTDSRYRQDKQGKLDEEARAAFFASGESHIRRMLSVLAAHFGFELGDEDCCADFGSGVGRLLIPMARRCRRAIGFDISPTMRMLCLENALEHGVAHIECFPGLPHSRLESTTFNWVNSYIVLQHMDTETGYQALDRLLRKVDPGGAISLHFPIFKDKRAAEYITGSLKYFTVDQEGVRTIVPSKPFYKRDAMMMNDYDATRIYMILHENGFDRVLTEHEDQEGMHGLIFYGVRNQP